MRFTETELHTISNALRVAAQVFRDDAAAVPQTRLRDQFARQEAAATATRDRIATETGIAS